jgi:hypothetical protein
MALSKLIYAFLSLTSVSTIYLLSENQKMCDDVDTLQSHTCTGVHSMNTERLDRIAERVLFLEGFSEQVWEKQK